MLQIQFIYKILKWYKFKYLNLYYQPECQLHKFSKINNLTGFYKIWTLRVFSKIIYLIFIKLKKKIIMKFRFVSNN
jgi:hypothetical protein